MSLDILDLRDAFVNWTPVPENRASQLASRFSAIVEEQIRQRGEVSFSTLLTRSFEQCEGKEPFSGEVWESMKRVTEERFRPHRDALFDRTQYEEICGQIRRIVERKSISDSIERLPLENRGNYLAFRFIHGRDANRMLQEMNHAQHAFQFSIMDVRIDSFQWLFTQAHPEVLARFGYQSVDFESAKKGDLILFRSQNRIVKMTGVFAESGHVMVKFLGDDVTCCYPWNQIPSSWGSEMAIFRPPYDVIQNEIDKRIVPPDMQALSLLESPQR